MANEDHSMTPGEHHARIRFTKRLLRFVPRRALFHKYPIVGRFAAEARKRAFLWSFKSAYVRPALYVGSILALQPVMGVQIPVAFLCAVLLRLNFMVLGGLQLISNHFTAAPLYYGTYQLGLTVINASGFGDSIGVIDAAALPEPAASAPAVETDPRVRQRNGDVAAGGNPVDAALGHLDQRTGARGHPRGRSRGWSPRFAVALRSFEGGGP